MARLRYNGVRGKLATAAGSADTSLTLTAALTHSGGTVVPALSNGDYFELSILDATTGALAEIVWVTQVSGSTITVVRAQEGTTASGHPVGRVLVNAQTAIDLGTATADTRKAVLVAQSMLTGGGILTYTNGAISWSQQFGALGLGSGLGGGARVIKVPANGTVIPGYGMPSVTVANGAIPMTLEYSTLYYDTNPAAIAQSNDNGFRFVRDAGIAVPDTWIAIATRFGADYNDSSVKFGNGVTVAINRPQSVDTPLGDTLCREVKTLLINGWTADRCQIRRAAGGVTLSFQNLTGTASTNDNFLNLGLGWGFGMSPSISLYYAVITNGLAVANTQGSIQVAGSGSLTFRHDGQPLPSGLYSNAFWPCYEIWPSTLPGVPA